MATTDLTAEPTAPTPRRAPVADPLRLALTLTWLALAVSTALIGHRPSTLPTLEQALAAGQVHAVTVHGTGRPPGTTGQSTQKVTWREHGLRRSATVIARTPAKNNDTTPANDATVITATDVGTYLRAGYPDADLRVTRTDIRPGSDGVLGWNVPGWLAALLLTVNLLTLVLIVHGPQPWRATRWAWFWLWTTPIGTPAFLLLSGPVPLLPAPRTLNRRLTGGWAFLLSLIIGTGT